MISYPRLGKIGRLGNHLFQIAAAMGLALDHGDNFGFPRWEYEKAFNLSGCFYDSISISQLYREPRFAFDAIPYQSDLSIEGFFQSEKYFVRHTDIVRRSLTPRTWSQASGFSGTASLHIRRGDYLLLPEKHPLLPMHYYLKAMEMLRERGTKKFLVFSDDLPWCRAQPWSADVEIIQDMGTLKQFALTMSCEHHILANSTFSWWTAWLDQKPEKVVIAPADWFGKAYQAEFPTADLFPPEWVTL